MTLTITPIYAGLIALLFIVLSTRVIFYRRANLISTGDQGDKALLNRAVRASQLRDRIRQYEGILGEALEACHQHLDVAVQAFSVASAVQEDDEVYDGVFA